MEEDNDIPAWLREKIEDMKKQHDEFSSKCSCHESGSIVSVLDEVLSLKRDDVK